MTDLREKLRALRRFTGDSFTAAKGYDARKKLSRKRLNTIERYYDKLTELTASAHEIYKPKRGEKREVFEFTGQSHFPRFKVGIVRKYNPESQLTFERDRSRPTGSQFVVTDKKTGQQFVHIPAYAFVDVPLDGTEAEEFSAIIEAFAPDAKFFLINAGDSYLWGAGGSPDKVGDKVAELFRNYSAANFDPNNKNSSYYGNWFRGVTGFTSRYQVLSSIGEAQRNRREYREKWKMHPTRNYRELSNGLLGVFENGRLVETIVQTWRK